MIRRIFTVMLIIVLGIWVQQADAQHYSESTWSTLHHDSSNSDYIPINSYSDYRIKWHVLDNNMATRPSTFGPEGNQYVVTGQEGDGNHLWALDENGNTLWAKGDADGFDAFAFSSVPVIDSDGDLYISDSDQFWAFYNDGTVKWVTYLPVAGSPFVTAIITNEGYVGGVTMGGAVLLYDRNDGLRVTPDFVLDQGVPPDPFFDLCALGVCSGGLLDRDMVNSIGWALFGKKVQISNTPAVHPATNRLYISGAGDYEDEGILWGIDLIDEQLSIGFATPMGGGSGASPAISPDGSLVFDLDGNGKVTAFDAETGEEQDWEEEISGGSASSPTIGPDGTLYLGSYLVSWCNGQENCGNIKAINPDGTYKWARDYNYLANVLPNVEGCFLPRLNPLWTGKRAATTNAVLALTNNYLYVVMTLGYEYKGGSLLGFGDAGSTLVTPHKIILIVLDPEDGSLAGGPIELPNSTVDGTVTVMSNGNISINHASVVSLLFYNRIRPTMPWAIKRTFNTWPTGGTTMLEPLY